MAYQSLYRRYRPQKFSEIKGQDHVVRALQTAVREDKVGHAYLLHGPRGSGKTSTARVLAKALNCTDLSSDGEPCCACESCVSIKQGRSFDLQELDAASNNKVDDMRALLERVNLTSPGRAKVYLLDEVHMLTAGAENALLKTLEEPPSHVTWVLATTEPHKVVQTIRSRCQVFELGLIPSDIMSDHIRYVVNDAELDVDDAAIDHAVAAGGGSARDTLTALERVVAGGGTTDLDSSTDAILGALAEGDRAAALSAVGDAVGRGRDPRTIGEMVLAGLRDAFLTAMGDPPVRLSEHERARAADLASRMAPAAMTRALETLGRALIDMRQAPDPRVDIEVALVRLCHPDEDRSLEALAQRIQRLETRLDGLPASAPAAALPAPGRPAAPAAPAHQDEAEAPAPASAEAPAPASAAPAAAAPASAAAPAAAAAARRALLEHRASAPAVSSAPAAAPVSATGPAAAARRALSEHRASAPAAPSAPAAASVPAGGPAAPPPPVPVPDLASMRPRSPTEVVDLARRHLGLERTFVVARAVELEPSQERRRDPAQLQALWRDLLEHAAKASPEPDSPVPAPPADASDPASASESASASDPASASESESASASDPASASESASDPASASEFDPASASASASDPASASESASDPASASASDPASASASASDPASASESDPESASDPASASESVSASEPLPPAYSDARFGPADFHAEMDSLDLYDLEALDEAPSHADEIEQKIKAAFPGTEFAVLSDPDADGDQSGAGA